MGIKRRDFLIQSAFILSAARRPQWLARALTAEENEPLEEYLGPRLESWKNSICQLCPGGCGIRVRLVDGHPVKITGNPVSPINKGGLCPAGHSGLQLLYHPDRIRTPLQRVGKRGEGRWKSISWSEAIQLVASKLNELRKNHQSHQLAFFHHGLRGASRLLIQQFMKYFGSPNFISLRFQEIDRLPFYVMMGIPDPLAIDFSETRFILSFGRDFLDSEGPPAWMAKIFGKLRQNKKGYRIKIVQVDSRFSITAAKADKWIFIRPGTAAALALGIAHIMIVEGLHDHQFVQENTWGFEDWTDESGHRHIGFKNFVLQNYYPERVSQITGVPIEELVSLARQFANNRPAIAFWGEDVSFHNNALLTQMAILALNALVGSLGWPGGFVAQPQEIPSAIPNPPVDAIAQQSLQQPAIGEGLLKFPNFRYHSPDTLLNDLKNQQPYPIQVAFLYGANPVFELPTQAGFLEALQRIPFLVSLNPFLDETSRYCDLILPDHIYLEKIDLDFGVPFIPFMQVGLSQPVISPVYHTQHILDTMLQIAHQLGESLSAALPFASAEEFIKMQAKALFDSHRGFIPSSSFEEFMYSYLLERGVRFPQFRRFQDFWEELKKQGHWVEYALPVAKRSLPFQTPSGRFEFFSSLLQTQFRKQSFILADFTKEFDEETFFFPHYQKPHLAGDANTYPLILHPFHILTLFEGEAANRVMMLEMVGFRHYIRWNTWAEIHPETARQYGIRDRDWIWIESPVGRIRCRAKIFPGAAPGMIYLPYGLGHSFYGKKGTGHGANPNNILVFATDKISGQIARNATRVRIYKARTTV